MEPTGENDGGTRYMPFVSVYDRDLSCQSSIPGLCLIPTGARDILQRGDRNNLEEAFSKYASISLRPAEFWI